MTRIFACLQLTKMHSNVATGTAGGDGSVQTLKMALNMEVAVGLILILLDDTSSVIRQHGMNFAAAYDVALASTDFDGLTVTCFDKNKKIVSLAKRSADEFVPLAKSVTAHLLKTLGKSKLELVEDRNQLATTLNKVKH